MDSAARAEGKISDSYYRNYRNYGDTLVSDNTYGETKIMYHKGDLPPEGAVRINDETVLAMQYGVINRYKPKSEIWPFTYGVGIAGGLTAISGIVCNSIFRSKLKLYHYKGLTTLVATCIIPCMCSMMFQAGCVMKPILLRQYDCPLCITNRAVMGQMLVAGVQTPTISFFACASVATFGFKYKMPPLNQPLAWLKKAHSLTKPHYGTILLLTLLNGLYAGALAYQQQITVHKIHRALMAESESALDEQNL